MLEQLRLDNTKVLLAVSAPIMQYKRQKLLKKLECYGSGG
jgi:hypothetical protein